MKLPDYQSINYEIKHFPKVLREVAKELTFPLTKEDLKDIKILEEKYDMEKNCAGLAAPQIGISKKIIVFGANDPELKKWREDFTQMMDKTIWINPSYEPQNEDTRVDYEGCFSVTNRAGNVKRYQSIRYKAFDIHGKKIEGTAEGFLARIIQHEVDHVNGILFVDRVNLDELINIEEYLMKKKDSLDT